MKKQIFILSIISSLSFVLPCFAASSFLFQIWMNNTEREIAFMQKDIDQQLQTIFLRLRALERIQDQRNTTIDSKIIALEQIIAEQQTISKDHETRLSRIESALGKTQKPSDSQEETLDMFLFCLSPHIRAIWGEQQASLTTKASFKPLTVDLSPPLSDETEETTSFAVPKTSLSVAAAIFVPHDSTTTITTLQNDVAQETFNDKQIHHGHYRRPVDFGWKSRNQRNKENYS